MGKFQLRSPASTYTPVQSLLRVTYKVNYPHKFRNVL